MEIKISIDPNTTIVLLGALFVIFFLGLISR